MANNEGKFWKSATTLAGGLALAGIIGGIVMYGDLRVAKANDKTAKETNDKQDEIIAANTATSAVVASMARTVQSLAIDQKAFMNKMDVYIQEDIARDARSHHTHSGGGP